jgi:hypothetical protein
VGPLPRRPECFPERHVHLGRQLFEHGLIDLAPQDHEAERAKVRDMLFGDHRVSSRAGGAPERADAKEERRRVAHEHDLAGRAKAAPR